MGWFELSPEKKAEECSCCRYILEDGGAFEVCERCGHLYFIKEKYCACEE